MLTRVTGSGSNARPATSLVTGAAGFIGSRLVERLLAAGQRVIGVDCLTDYYDPEVKRANLVAARQCPAFVFIESDLVTADLRLLLSGVDEVYHLAGQPGVRDSWGPSFDVYLRQNVLATQRLLEAVAEHPVPVVMASTSSVYGDSGGRPLPETAPLRPVSPYGMTKGAMEQLVEVYRRDRGLPIVLLRYFTVYGPHQRPDMAFHRFIRAALEGRPVQLFGSGEQSRDFTFVDDVVSATIAALRGPSPVYNIGGGTPATVNEVIAIISQLVGAPVTVQRDGQARGDVMHTWADTGRARGELGWSPATSLYEGLAAQVASLRSDELVAS